MLCSCTNNKFKVEGKVEGAGENATLVLEEMKNGMWLVVDSVAADGDGSFSLKAQAPEYPNIYRLRMGDKSIEFPVDSLDNLVINTTLKDFDTEYTVKGSEHAEQVMNIDKEARTLAGAPAEKIEAFRKKVAKLIQVEEYNSIVAYYAIYKKLSDGQSLFDPDETFGMKIINAVANAFLTHRPKDPRTEYLKNVALAAQQRNRVGKTPAKVVQATETSLLDMTLDDFSGKKRQLSKVAEAHKVVLLSFTIYQSEFSPVYNKLLNDIYKANKDRGLEIYQISLDGENAAWMQAAQNLPWISVYDPAGERSINVGNYNVTGVPTTFVISNGSIVERVEDQNKLQAAVAKYM